MSVPTVAEQLAWDLISIASLSGMPGTYWLTDSRIQRACGVLDITPEQAREWAESRLT